MEKERYLIQLLDVIRVLKGPESDIARKHLRAYESNHTINLRKMFLLYKYIKINDIQDYDKLKKRISPDSTDDSFNKLIRRTTDRIQESLIIDVNIRRKGAYSDVFRTKFHLRKQIIQGQILLGRGLMERALAIFRNAVRYAKKYELYDELIEALFFIQIAETNTKGYKEANKISERILFYEKCRRYFNETKLIFREIEVSSVEKSGMKQMSDHQHRLIEKVRIYSEETSSVSILTYYYLLKLEENASNIQVLSYYTKQLIDLLISSPVVYSERRISYLMNELSGLSFKSLNFKLAYIQVEEAQRFAGKKILSNIQVNVTRLKLDICLGFYFDGIQKTTPLLDDSRINNQKYSISVISYLKAIATFGLKQYKEAQSILSQKNEIEKDKEGWNVWIRIMRLLCSIELLKLNMIDYDIESFRKYLDRTAKQYEVRERDKLVLKVLLELDKQDYDFELTAVKVSSELDKLRSTDEKYSWNPDSPELILFHDWFNAKLLKKEYEPHFDVYREAMKQKNDLKSE